LKHVAFAVITVEWWVGRVGSQPSRSVLI